MPTIAHRASRLPGQLHHKLTIWLLGAVVVAAVAIALALSLDGSGAQGSDPAGDGAPPPTQEPTQWGGARR
jgi:hypothetical protein